MHSTTIAPGTAVRRAGQRLVAGLGGAGRTFAVLAALALAAPAAAQTEQAQTEQAAPAAEAPASGPALQDTPARAALVVDVSSGATLFAKNAEEPLPPASMSKLMTLYMVFEALRQGHLHLDDEFRTSAKAASMGGSKMFIREGELVSVEDLLRGVIIQSGNDAAVALAEGMAGTEEAFAERMNRKAPEIGLTNSHFANSTGWPHPEQYMSTRDLVVLSELLIEEFPDLYPMFAETEFEWDGVKQNNRNPLLGLGVGADGLKTGHTEEAGYGLTASAKRGDRRIVMAIAGLDSQSQRAQESERLINWAFRAFETRKLFEQGQPLGEAPVWIGSRAKVGLAPARDVVLTAPLGSIDRAAMKIVYDGPVPAPIAAGQPVGRLEISVPDLAPFSVPLLATEAVGEGGFLSRIEGAARLLVSHVIPPNLLGG